MLECSQKTGTKMQRFNPLHFPFWGITSLDLVVFNSLDLEYLLEVELKKLNNYFNFGYVSA
jgi:hypothetical protein